jgi:fumarate hydratase subunit alpha
MRNISEKQISEAVEKLVIDCNYYLPYDVVTAIKESAGAEKNKLAKNALYKIVENYKIAKKGEYPLCQDTGIAVLFVELGNEVKVEGSLYDAINNGVEAGYKKGYLRESTADPLTRKNLGTNTPAIIHLELVGGPKIKISAMTKGAGAENKSVVKMLIPSDDEEGIKKLVLDTVKNAGASACPPYIIGVGIGGNIETAPLLAKKALLKDLSEINKDKNAAKLEKELLKLVNELNIGALGMGGGTTALAVKVETAPCHIASLPVAVNVQCHSARHKSISI